MPLLHISLNTNSDNHILSGDTCKFRVNLGHTIYPQHLKLRRALFSDFSASFRLRGLA